MQSYSGLFGRFSLQNHLRSHVKRKKIFCLQAEACDKPSKTLKLEHLMRCIHMDIPMQKSNFSALGPNSPTQIEA